MVYTMELYVIIMKYKSQQQHIRPSALKEMRSLHKTFFFAINQEID